MTNATLPYVVALAAKGAVAAVRADPELGRAVNVWDGRIVHPAVAASLGERPEPLDGALAQRPG